MSRNSIVKSDVPIGKVVYSTPLRPGDEVPFVNKLVAVVSLGVYVGWVYILILLGLSMLLYRNMIYVNILLWSTLLIPAPYWYQPFLESWLFETWRQYFYFSFKMEEDLQDTEYVMAEFPHGIFPMGQILAATIVPGCLCFISHTFLQSIVCHDGSLTRHQVEFQGITQESFGCCYCGWYSRNISLASQCRESKINGPQGFYKSGCGIWQRYCSCVSLWQLATAQIWTPTSTCRLWSMA
eukprot:TRINITY_DN2672_c0_g2_i3.p2 TRINITY_DN2672_c0_g2~~TRINITY_DN2672_c0_g2_i3.p2  ORF type:complete len:246 (-),score=-4.46 TRINITY_DN2672_c0_g2_i3:17-733(-)